MTPRDLLALPAAEIGETAAAEACADLLAADDPHDEADLLLFLGGPAGRSVLDGGEWRPYWARVWAARGLLYVWTDAAEPVVVRRLGDEHWRVAEMCVKVAARRELGTAGPGVAALSGHELPRVRAAVVRALGVIGDTEHLDVVRVALEDPDVGVRSAAERAGVRMAARLDVTWAW